MSQILSYIVVYDDWGKGSLMIHLHCRRLDRLQPSEGVQVLLTRYPWRYVQVYFEVAEVKESGMSITITKPYPCSGEVHFML